MLDAVYWVAALVLVVAGATKVADPDSTESTLRGIGFGVPKGTGRAVGVLEVVLGVAALLVTGDAVARVVAVLVGLVYLAFAGVVLAAIRGGLDDCGCLGVRSRAPSRGHAVLNAALGAVAIGAAISGPVDVAGGLASVSVPWAVVVGLGVAMAAGVVVSTV